MQQLQQTATCGGVVPDHSALSFLKGVMAQAECW